MVKLQSTTMTSEVKINSLQEAREIQAMLLKYGVRVRLSENK